MTDNGEGGESPRADGAGPRARGHLRRMRRMRPGGDQGTERGDKAHFKRMGLYWFGYMAVSEPLIWFILWPAIPPFRLTRSAASDQWDALVAIMIANGATAVVLIYGVYALFHWRYRQGDPEPDGPALRSSFRVQAGWVFVVTCTVLGAFIFGTVELIVPNGAGSGEGPAPIWVPASKNILPVQVIGQQWIWTYRYPTFGGFETTQLMIPDNTTIAFHVTSLDVVHDWWAYQLGIKADANPGTDDVAFTTTAGTGLVTVRCDELCGIWHGAMYGYGHVVSKASFENWGLAMEKKLAPLTRELPKFAWTYFPTINGAHPGNPYYPPSEDPYYQMYQYLNGTSGQEGDLGPVPVTTPSPLQGPSGPIPVPPSEESPPQPSPPTIGKSYGSSPTSAPSSPVPSSSSP